jgi:hypothetical protein
MAVLSFINCTWLHELSKLISYPLRQHVFLGSAYESSLAVVIYAVLSLITVPVAVASLAVPNLISCSSLHRLLSASSRLFTASSAVLSFYYLLPSSSCSLLHDSV